jgi:hypothetical protein
MAQRKETKNMATKETQLPDPLGGDKPAYLIELEKQGPIQSEDNFDQSDVAIPRVKLLQGLSDECETFNEAKPGLFWHTGYDKALTGEFDFVPVSRRKRYLLVAPLEDGQGVLARADDFVNWTPPQGKFEVRMKGRKEPVIWTLAPTVAESGLDKWGSYNPDDSNSPPAATLFYEYLVLLPLHLDLGPVVLSLTRSQIRKARKGLNDKIQLHESAGRPMQSLVFRAKAFKDSSPEGEFFNFSFTSNGFVQSESLFKNAMELKDVLVRYRVADEEKAAHGQDDGVKETGESKEF